MPDPSIIRHAPALAGEVDARSVAGTTLFTRIDTGSQVNTATLSADAGVFWDLPAFLHGYASSPTASLQALVSAGWGGPGTIKVTIDINDMFRITSTETAIALEPSPSNEMFGFNNAGEFSVIDGGVYVITAAQPWKRGIFELPEIMEITNTNTGATYPFVSDLPRVQSLPTWLRSRGQQPDADDVYAGLTVEDADPQDLAFWCVEPDGRVSVSYYEDNGFLLGTNFDFWRMLGGTGSETPINGYGGRQTLTTTHRAPSFLALDFSYISLRRTVSGPR